MHWVYLLLAAVCEIAFVFGMKLSDGFTKLYISIATLVIMGVGVFLLSLAVKNIQLGTAYAIWTGLGVAGTVLIGIFCFGESFSFLRLVCIGMILTGVVGLKLI